MKGKITRVALVLLSLALLLGSLAGCGKNNPSVLTLPDGTASAGDAQQTPGPLTSLGDRTCKVGQETIPESTLFSFVLNSADFDSQQGLTLQFVSTNKSPVKTFTVELKYLSANGYMQDAGYEAQVPANESVAGQISIPAEDFKAAGVSSVDELILYPLIYDESMSMGEGNVVEGAFSFYLTGQSAGNVAYPVRRQSSTEKTFFDNLYATFVVQEIQKSDDGTLLVDCYMENKTERYMSFAWSDMTVNDQPVSSRGDTMVAPGMRRYAQLPIEADEVSEQPYQVAFKIVVAPLSDDGSSTVPVVEQRVVYAVGAISSPSTTGATGTDPELGTEPDDPEVTASPAATMIIYTTPTAAQKRNAKSGYVNKDKVNMRTGPGTKYKTVGNKLEQNAVVTMYELQEGWWFLKCGNHYGYVKADYISQGKPKATAEDEKTFAGVVDVQTKAALRKSADPESKCLKELSDGAKVTVYYKTKGKDGHIWYYVASGKTKGYIRSDLLKVTGKVPSR